jgi:hypothetical protein
MLGRRSVLAAVACMSTIVLVAGCTDDQVASDPPTTVYSPAATAKPTKASAEPTKSPTSPAPTAIPSTFSPKNFGATPTDVNQWVPLTPGLQSVSKGFVTVGDRRLPHIKVTTVTDVTKEIDGVRAMLILDQDFDGGQLSEQAVDYLAEDEGGNVWYLGSYTEVYEGGRFLNAEDAWLAGVNGADVGLYFPGGPKAGSPPFTQVSIPGGEVSTAQVAQVSQQKCVPFKCFTDVVVVVEQGSENKYWAPGAGQILTEPLSGSAQEIEELVNLTQLSPTALAELSAEALRLDRNAASTASSVFGGSKAAERNR